MIISEFEIFREEISNWAGQLNSDGRVSYVCWKRRQIARDEGRVKFRVDHQKRSHLGWVSASVLLSNNCNSNGCNMSTKITSRDHRHGRGLI